MEPKTPWMGEYVWEENRCDGSAPVCVPLPDEVVAMFRPSKCLLCGTVTSNQQSAFTHYESKGHFKKVAQYMREKHNVLGTLKSREKFRPVRCELCQIDITSRVVLMQHYDGKQHLKNLKKKSDGTPVITETKETADTSATISDGDYDNPMDFIKDLPPPPPLPKLGTYFCSLCQIKSKSKAQMEIHNSGARHQKNLSKLADGELKEFFLRNGNCEPVESDAQEHSPPSTPAADNQVDNPFPQASTPAPVGGFPYPPVMDPSMGMPMMPNVPPPPFPQMPYGQYPQYPQYPQGYDYNAWNQGQQSYNAGQQPYGNYNAPQQPYGQPMYNAGPFPNQYNNQQQYPANQQTYPATQQTYPATQPSFLSGPPPFLSAPQNQNDSCPAAPGTTDTIIENPITSSQPPETTTPTSEKFAKAASDSFWSRKWGGSSPSKEPEVRESPVPDDFEIKPLAVSNFIKLLAKEAKLEKEAKQEREAKLEIEPKLEVESNSCSANTHVKVEKVDGEKDEKMGEGDSSSTTTGMDGLPKNEAPSSAVDIDDSAGEKVDSKSVGVTYSPAYDDEDEDDDDDDVDRSVGVTGPTPGEEPVTASEEVVKRDDQVEVKDEFSVEKTSKIGTDEGKGEEGIDEKSNPIVTPEEESGKSSESPPQNGKQDPDQDSKIAAESAEPNVGAKKSVVAPSVSNANKTSTDGFSFKIIGGKPTVSLTKVSTLFRRSNEKMLKDTMEKKKLEGLKKLKDKAEVNDGENPLAEKVDVTPNNVEQTRETINSQSNKEVESTTKPPKDKISKNTDEGKLDKSDGEITDDPGELAAAAASSELVSESLPVLKDTPSTKNSVSDGEDRVDIKKEPESKNSSSKEEQKVQNDLPKPDSSSDKHKSRTKKFSASDKKKVSRTRNSSSDTSRKSRSRSRSHHKRSRRRHSSSWSPSSEDEVSDSYQGKNDNYRQDNYRQDNFRHDNYRQDNYQNNYYGYNNNNRNRNWRNNRGYFHHNNTRGFQQRNYWDHQRYSNWENQDDFRERHYDETDEFGREKRRREDKKKEKRESRKRRKERSPSVVSSSSRSSSDSRSKPVKKQSKSEKKHKICKKRKLPSPDIKMKKTVQTPEVPKPRIMASVSPIDAKQTPLTLAQKLRLAKSDRIKNTPPVEKKDRAVVEVEHPVGDPVRRVRKQTPPVVVDEKPQTGVIDQKRPLSKPVVSPKILEALEKEREKQEILKKMALIKMSLQQKEKAKQDKKKKKKKEKSKKKKKKRSLSTSSSSSSSSSSSDSSLSSSSSSSSSHSENLAEKLLAKMKRDAKAAGPSSLPDFAKVFPLLKKNEPEEAHKKKKRKKNKKEKKKKAKKSRKVEPSQSSLASYITPSGTYFCKYCNVTLASGNTFIEHLLSEKHKLLYKLVKEKEAG